MAKGKNMDSKFIKGNAEGPNKPNAGSKKGSKSGDYAHRDQSKNVPNPGNLNAIKEWNKGKHSTKE